MKQLLLLLIILIFFIPLQCLSQSFQTIGAVTATLPANQDATTLNVTPSESTGGTYNIFQVSAAGTAASTSCAATGVYFAIQFNGNMCFSASNLQLSSTGAAPYLYLNGTNSIPGQPFLKASTAALNVPTLGTLTSGSGSLSGVQYVLITYVNAAGETTKSNEQTITLGASSSLIVPAPSAEYSAFGYQIYVGTSSGGETLRIPTSSNCTLASQTFGSNAVCALGANATFTSLPTGGAAPPTVNSTGGAQIASLAPYAEAPGLFLTSSAPGAEATLNSGLILPGGEGVNLTSGATTTAQTLACFSASETVSQCGANAVNVMGVFTGSGQYAAVQINGIATINLASSATTTYGHYACSDATAGTIVDSSSACATGQQVGIIAQTNGSAVSSVPVFLQPASGGGTCANCIVTNPSATQAIQPANSSTEGLIIRDNGGQTTDNFDVFQNGYDALRVDPYGIVRVGHDMVAEYSLTVDDNQTGNNLVFGSNKDQISFSNNATGNGDARGQIVISAATSGSFTFPSNYNSAPACVASPVGTTPSGIPNWEVSTSTTQVIITLSASATLTFNYICMGMPN